MDKLQKYHLLNDLLIHLAFAIWAGMALWFFQERLYSDAGFFISKVVHYETFWMELNRFMRVFSQWLPLIFIKLGFDLKTVLLAYSFGHVLFFYSIFLIGRYAWGHRWIGWLMLLTQTVGILHGFCAPGYELYYCGGFLALFAVILNQNNFTRRNNIYLLLLVITMVVNYQLIIFMIGGVLLLHFAEHKLKYWRQYALVGAAIIACFLFKQRVTSHSYEVAKMDNFIHNIFHQNYGWEAYIKPLLGFYGKYYVELWGIVALTLLVYLKEKRYWLSLGFVLFLVLTQYIVALTYPEIRQTRYQEQCYFPLIYVACFPLLMHCKKHWRVGLKMTFSLSLFLLIMYRFWTISVHIEPFTHRVNYMHRVIEAAQELEGNKFIVHEGWWNTTFGNPSWTMGMESILLSGLNPNRKTIQLILDWEWNQPKISETLQDSNLYLFTYRSFYDRTDSIYQHQEANEHYYNFPAGKYRFINGQVPKLKIIEQLQKGLTIKTYAGGPYEAGTQANVLTKLTLGDSLSINSDQTVLSYHWWKDGKVLDLEGRRTPFEVDLYPQQEYYQYLLVDMPPESGQYELQVDAVTRDSLGWMNYSARVPVLVN